MNRARVTPALVAAMTCVCVVVSTRCDARGDATTSPSPAATASASSSPTPDPTYLPPPGIEATKVTLRHVLALYGASEGKTPSAKTSRETQTITAYGATGSSTEVDSGGDWTATTRIGPSTVASGSYHGQLWRRDENGYTRTLSGVHLEDAVSTRVWKDAVSGSNVDWITLLGTVKTPVDAYVVQIDPPGGRLRWLFVDRTTGDVVREEQADGNGRETYTFGDFRKTSGTVAPWHEHFSDGTPVDESDRQTTRLEYGVPVSQAELAIPPSRKVVRFPQGVTEADIPAIFDDGAIVVHVEIGGRGLDLELDSGASGIILDADVARQLGLQTYNTQSDSFSTTSESSSATVPELTVGSLTMDDVVVNCLPFYYNPDAEHKVVGLLGYDFIAGAVVKVDYVDRTVEAYDPSTFKAPGAGAVQLPIRLDDAVPEVDAQIGARNPGNFIIDTGAQELLVFDDYARAHADDLALLGYEAGGRLYYPKETAEGVGGYFYVRPMEANDFFIGDEGFGDVRLGETSALETEDVDGLIGYPILQYYDVYFDYPHGTVTLRPNSVFDSMLKK